ncbi:MAG: hypothetical protein D6680_16780 [Cyanobacteria bacterium J007]|nr:MAG: hypothetical protein D6680_16780 [Cyanobacteria bacterium J007]
MGNNLDFASTSVFDSARFTFYFAKAKMEKNSRHSSTQLRTNSQKAIPKDGVSTDRNHSVTIATTPIAIGI